MKLKEDYLMRIRRIREAIDFHVKSPEELGVRVEIILNDLLADR